MCFRILWKARHGGRRLEDGARARVTPFPTLSRGHSAEVPLLVFQSKTVAAVIPFLCFKKTAVVSHLISAWRQKVDSSHQRPQLPFSPPLPRGPWSCSWKVCAAARVRSASEEAEFAAA